MNDANLRRVVGHEDPPRIIVAHPERQHSYQTALAVQEKGWLQNFVTGFYYKKPGLLSSAVSLLGSNYRPRVERQLIRRRLSEIDQDLVRCFPLGDVLNRVGLLDFHSKIRRFDRRVARLVRRTRPAAVICYDTCALETFRAAKQIGALRILDQTGGHLTQAQKVFERHGIDFPVSEETIRQSLEEAKAADAVLAGSEYVKEGLKIVGVEEDRIRVLPYGVNIEEFGPGEKQDDGEFRILFVGRVSHKKGIQHLVGAFEELNLTNATLHVAGWSFDGAAWAQKYGGKIIYHSHIPHHEVHELYRRCDIFVVPSLHEGSSLVIYEALAAGLPVITTPNAGSVVTDGIDGFVVPVGDLSALKEKILVLHRDAALRRRMSDNARKKAEQYTWARYRQRLGDILGNILNR